MPNRITFKSGLISAALVMILSASPVFSAVGHVTDGTFSFGGAESPEWTSPKAVKTVFPVVGNAGGAVLYVEQGNNSPTLASTLFLMYDYTNGTAGNTNSFFDVFFELPNDGEDYLVRIPFNGSSISVFEKDSDQPSGFTGDGSFDVASSPWGPVSPGDLALANFHAATSIGSSPNSAAPHLIAEFDLTIDTIGSNNPSPHDGIYDPAPAFWSGSKGSSTPGGDPPFSSAIFTLNPDGSTTVVPALGPNGAPIQELPEPASLGLVVLGGVMLLKRRRA